ncbi:hypothetical protein PHMEG_00041162 [Phytophthora megakarya]|uniref:Retroviral polymerase SH3-like domain-containing protein n=1 Tax=Phytophthora megakarya TaxID=4795 RepID=A0A225UCE7_9STRA|nr:hypothetical protein PHMEG_00041162 [Phytophthora megakarya]
MMSGIRCALRVANMAPKWWPEDLLYTVYITNRLPMARLKMKLPYALIYGKMPYEYGFTCYAHVPKTKKDAKLGERAIECKLSDFSSQYKRYHLLEVKANKFLIARDVKFSTTVTDAKTVISYREFH